MHELAILMNNSNDTNLENITNDNELQTQTQTQKMMFENSPHKNVPPSHNTYAVVEALQEIQEVKEISKSRRSLSNQD